MKFCKKCHRRVVEKIENDNASICECKIFRECKVSLEVVSKRLSYGSKKDVAEIKRVVLLNCLGSK